MEKKVEEALEWYDQSVDLYERFSSDMTDIVKKLLDRKKIPYHSIDYRVKTKKSFGDKCRKEKYVDPVNEIMDLSGIRIIAYTKREVQEICKVIQDEFDIDMQNSGDKADVMEDDKVGYLSVHYVMKMNADRTKLAEYEEFQGLRCEIQIRTLLQHAWAEIEHDKNYKFSGVLPKDIRRRFYLVAGVLEMMDREFDELSREIDKYSKEVKAETAKGNFDEEINTESLTQYLLAKFGKKDYLRAASRDSIVDKNVIEELKGFGFHSIKDIDDLLSDDMAKKIDDHGNTYIGMLRDFMIITDVDKYFSHAYKGAWKGCSGADIKFWRENGVEIERYLEENDIMCLYG